MLRSNLKMYHGPDKKKYDGRQLPIFGLYCICNNALTVANICTGTINTDASENDIHY
jgi:hypothetical protein